MELKSKKTLEGAKKISHPLGKPVQRYVENVLTPISLSGVVIPWSKEIRKGQSSDFKLVCSSGLEYFIVTDSEWRDILSWYSWEEVKVIGLLNVSNMTIIPQKVFPKGPTGEKENVIDLAAWKSREFLKKLVKNVNDLVLIPAAVCAVMA
jgi:hypothetical protein